VAVLTAALERLLGHGICTLVVSMTCVEVLELQPAKHCRSVLPASKELVVMVEGEMYIWPGRRVRGQALECLASGTVPLAHWAEVLELGEKDGTKLMGMLGEVDEVRCWGWTGRRSSWCAGWWVRGMGIRCRL